MFENLTERLSKTLRNIMGRGKLTEENIKATLAEVRAALLEADCALEAVESFIETVKVEALGLEVGQGLDPAQAFVKLVHQRLIVLMGDKNVGLDLKCPTPAVILLAGLQGSGKTTSAAKLSRLLKEKNNKSVMLVSCDVYRPAAILQLERLATEVGVMFYASGSEKSPGAILQGALNKARSQFIDVLIVDTAGRMHIDLEMMAEIKELHALAKPIETLFVVDGMTGQDAARTAQAFNSALPLTGVIVTKLDGDARGGAILSIRYVTQGKPIKFIGMGEKTDALEPFHPERMASRILGMGDVLSLIEQMEQHVDQKEAKRMADKLKKGKGFNFEDFRQQLLQMQKMGGIASLMDKMPGLSGLPAQAKEKANDKSMGQMLAIINSMTKKERRYPDLIKGSRKLRIANGSGTSLPEVNKVLKQFDKMQKMMKQLSQKGGLSQLMKSLPKGMMPPTFPN
jgi:signal recognition particle subunit SRP54